MANETRVINGINETRNVWMLKTPHEGCVSLPHHIQIVSIPTDRLICVDDDACLMLCRTAA